MSYGFEMNGTNNKPFDLKVGDMVRSPGYLNSDTKEHAPKKDIRYKVVAIYPHIFIAETVDLFVEKFARRRCFRKADYVCGRVRRA